MNTKFIKLLKEYFVNKKSSLRHLLFLWGDDLLQIDW